MPSDTQDNGRNVPPVRDEADQLRMPKVSVVIVNFNYAAHLHGTVGSVLAQTYPNVEIIIVDDKSTDESLRVIAEIQARHPGIVLVDLPENVGQTAASFKGLCAASGAYVLFLDADDQLLTECVEAHVFAHLSSRIAIAFTSVDILNNVAGQDVNLSHAGFAGFVASGKGRRPGDVRGIDRRMPKSWFGARAPAVAEDQLHFVMPPHADPWVWSPTSANCYRRDALDILLRDPGMDTLRLATDTYLARPLSALFGSILIDRPLVRYVKHETNNFLLGAPLQNALFFDPEPEKVHTIAATKFAVRRLMSCVGGPILRYEDPQLFFRAMDSIVESWPGIPPEGRGPGFYAEQLKTNRASLSAAFGTATVDFEIKDFPRRARKAG